MEKSILLISTMMISKLFQKNNERLIIRIMYAAVGGRDSAYCLHVYNR